MAEGSARYTFVWFRGRCQTNGQNRTRALFSPDSHCDSEGYTHLLPASTTRLFVRTISIHILLSSCPLSSFNCNDGAFLKSGKAKRKACSRGVFLCGFNFLTPHNDLWVHCFACCLLAVCNSYHLCTCSLSVETTEREGQAEGGAARRPHALPRERAPRRDGTRADGAVQVLRHDREGGVQHRWREQRGGGCDGRGGGGGGG